MKLSVCFDYIQWVLTYIITLHQSNQKQDYGSRIIKIKVLLILTICVQHKLIVSYLKIILKN